MQRAALVVLFLISLTLSAQENNTKSKFGLESKFNFGEFIFFNQMDGSAGINSDCASSFGISYSYNFKNNFWFETGLLYQKVESEITPAPTALPVQPYSAEIWWMEIPMYFRMDLKPWFFFKGGAILALQSEESLSTSLNNQGGWGVFMGMGFNIPMYKAIRLELESGIKVLSVLSFKSISNNRHYVAPTLGVRITYRK